MALYRGSTKLSGIGRVPGTEYMTQATYDALPSSKLTDNVNRGIYTDDEDTTLEKFIKNGVEYCLGGGGGVKYGYVDMLLVGGGGSGGTYTGGGGGAGGFLECNQFVLANSDICHSIVVGEGGCLYCNGGDSCFDSIVAFGGGHGGCCVYQGNNGGSGGGGSAAQYNTVGGCGCTGQGNNGGDGCCGYYGGGGGGGAGCPGCPSTCNKPDGGIGKCSCISGECCWYSGGGGGGGSRGIGGCGGGGDGGCSNCPATNGYYYGGGGGGGRNAADPGGCGYQGVVILRYKTDGSCGIKPTSSGGTKYTCGDYTIHCFCAVGTDYFIPVF